MRSLRSIVLSSLFLLVVAGCATAPDFNPATAPVSQADAAGLPAATVRSIMMNAAASRGWVITSDAPDGIALLYKGQTAKAVYSNGVVKVFQTGGDRDVTRWIVALNSEIMLRLNQAR